MEELKGSSAASYIVFVDESGDHSLESIDADYPIFVLSFCIIKKSDYVEQFIPRIKKLKFDIFGHDLAILHERDIRRKTGWFNKLGKAARESLMTGLTQIMEETQFSIIAVIIDKNKLKRKYATPDHPYHLALQFGLERLEGFLRSRGEQGLPVNVICEARGNKEDRDLELAFRRVCDGENFAKQKYPHEIHIADKKCNSEGLQIADLTARPIGMSYLRPDQENRAYTVLEEKFCANLYGNYNGIGRKTFP